LDSPVHLPESLDDVPEDPSSPRVAGASFDAPARQDSVQALYRLSEAVAGAGSVAEVLNIALDALSGTLGVDRASVLLFDFEGVMRFRAWRGLSDGYRAAVEGHSPWKQGEPNPTPLTIGDIQTAEVAADLKATILAEGIRSLAFIPLCCDGRLLGKFMIYRGDTHEFSPEEIRLAQTVAHHISFVLGRNSVIERLRRSEERVKVALAAGRLGAWEWEVGSGKLTWSETLEAIHGLRPGTFGGRFEDFAADIHPEDRERVLANIQRTLRSSQDEYAVQYRIVRADGALRWLEAHGRVMRARDGDPCAMTGVCQDVTDRKEAEATLRESEERFRAMADSAPVLIWVSGADKGGTYFNKTWLEFTGRTAEQEAGEGWLAGVHPEDVPALGVCAAGFRARQPFTTNFRLRRRDGEYRWILDTATPRYDHRGEFQGFIGSCVDVTEIEQAQATLEAHRDHLETLVAERTAQLEQSHQRLRLSERMASIGTLAAGLGHDMANLLLPIRSHIESLGSHPDVPAAVRADVDAIGQCAQYLQRLTNGLRMLALDPADSRLENRTRVQHWWPEVAGLLRGILPRSVKFSHDVPEDLPDVAVAPHRLAQAIFNLVSNAADALRARGDGEVCVRFAADGEGAVRIEVADDGPGMSAGVAERALEPFFSTKVRTVSTGLGLSLVHGIVKGAGGRLEIQSREGEGATVRLWVPAAGEGSTPAQRAVLAIVDPARRAFVGGLLREMGLRVCGVEAAAPDTRIAVLDGSGECLDHARRVRRECPRASLLVLASEDLPADWGALEPAVVRVNEPLSRVRDRLCELL
jgi:PAS domain S-box-containing protein